MRNFHPRGPGVTLSTDFDLLELARRGPVHFMGIGGAGMSPLAEMALLAGVRVTGCDSSPGPATQHLEDRGAVVWQGHDPSHVAGKLALAHLLSGSGRTRDAISLLKKGPTAGVESKLAELLYAHGDVDEAVNTVERINGTERLAAPLMMRSTVFTASSTSPWA